MPREFHPELVTMPEVFTPARTARFWGAVLETVSSDDIPTELAMTVHLAQFVERLEVRPSETTQFGYFIGGMIERRKMHGSYSYSVRNSWIDMRTMPVKYLRTFMANLGAPFNEMAFQTLFTLYPAGIAAQYSGLCNRSWREGRSQFMSMSKWTDDLELMKTYEEAPHLVQGATYDQELRVYVEGGVPGPYAERCRLETVLSPEETVEAWKAGLPFEYIQALQGAGAA